MTTILELTKEFNSDIGNTMFLALNYDLGGINYYSTKVEPRGYRLSFTHAYYNNGVKEVRPTDNKNFRIFIKEVKRKSNKLEARLSKEVIKHQEELFDAFSKDDKEEVINIINKFNI